MAAEFFITFTDPAWYAIHRRSLEIRAQDLRTFVSQQGGEFRLRGIELGAEEGRWDYDVRLFFLDEARILIDISSHPISIECDVSSFLSFIRKETGVAVVDEDGDLSGW